MNTKKTLFYLLAVVLGGCVPVASVHCLYTKENAVFEEKLLGTWVQEPNSPKTIWEFTRHDEEPNNVYKLIFTDEEGKKGSFVAVMVKLKDKLFLDAYPSELPWEIEDPNQMEWPYNSFFLIPAHTFIKVDSIEPQLKLRITMDDKMDELLKENPDAIEHILIEDRIVLTAKTKQLQEFILKYADDERLFVDEIALDRKKAPDKKPVN
jgi:hypothetical protein